MHLKADSNSLASVVGRWEDVREYEMGRQRQRRDKEEANCVWMREGDCN